MVWKEVQVRSEVSRVSQGYAVAAAAMLQLVTVGRKHAQSLARKWKPTHQSTNTPALGHVNFQLSSMRSLQRLCSFSCSPQMLYNQP